MDSRWLALPIFVAIGLFPVAWLLIPGDFANLDGSGQFMVTVWPAVMFFCAGIAVLAIFRNPKTRA